MLELNEEKAKDLNDIIAKALEKNQPHSDGFEIRWYKKIKPDFSINYLLHLHSLLKYYNEKYNRDWIDIEDNGFLCANSNTGYFFDQGGYLTIWKSEAQDELIKELTVKQLQKTIWQIKGWWIFAVVNAVISFLVAWLTQK